MSSDETAALRARVLAACREHSTATALFHAAVADGLGLSATDVKALDLLRRGGPLTAGALGQQTGLASASVTSLIDRLEARGLVRRTADPTDRRRVLVALDDTAEARVLPAFAGFGDAFAQLLAPYGPDELAVIVDFLERSGQTLRIETRKIGGSGRG